MRILLFLLAVVPLSAMVIDIYLERQREGREATFIDLAGKLVVEELGAPARQRVIGALVAAPEENDGQWGLRGKLFLADEAGEKAHRRISANFEQTCSAIASADCWKLASLTVDGELVLPSTGDASGATVASRDEEPAPEPFTEAAPDATPSETVAVEAKAESLAAAPVVESTPEEAPAESPTPTPTWTFQEAPPEADVAAEEPVATEPAATEPVVAEIPAEEMVTATEPLAEEAAKEEVATPMPQTEAILETVREAAPAPPTSRVAQRPAATIDLTKTMVEPPAEAEQADETQTAKAAPAKTTADIQSIALTAAVQAALNELGYNQSVPLKVDGKMGPRTRVAIRDYQQDHDLDLEGRPSRRLLFHMREQLKKRSAARIDSQKTTVSLPEVPTTPQQVKEPEAQVAIVSDDVLALPEAPEAPTLHNGEHETGGVVAAARSQIATRSASSEPTAVQAASVIGTTRPSEANLDRGLIYLIQDRLVKLGYEGAEPLKLDGKFGDHTKALIFAYMRDHSLTGRTEPSRELLRHMEEALRQARLRGNVGTQR